MSANYQGATVRPARDGACRPSSSIKGYKSYPYFLSSALALILVITVTSGCGEDEIGHVVTCNPDCEFLLQKAAERDLRIVILLNMDFTDPSELSSEELEIQNQRISDTQQQLIDDMSGLEFRTIRQFENLPNMTLFVGVDGLRFLLDSTLVTSVAEDVLNFPEES